jgi:hypothetical protein
LIRHVVMFKFKPSVNDAERNEAVAQLRELPGLIPEIRSYEVGFDVLRGPRSWDAVIVSTYDDLQGLDRYQSHAAHVPVAGLLRTICDQITTVDFEV